MNKKPREESVLATPLWRTRVREFLADQPRGYATKMCLSLGCTKSIFYKILDGSIRTSTWVPKISKYTGVSIKLEFDDVQTEELFKVFDSLSDEDQALLIEQAKLLKKRQTNDH